VLRGRAFETEQRTVRGPCDEVRFVLLTPLAFERRLVRGDAVDDETGAPVRNLLYGHDDGRTWHTAEPRADPPGGFVCDALPETGTIRITFSAAGYLPPEPIDVTRVAGEPVEPITLRLHRGAGEIEVLVREENGAPVAGAGVFVERGGPTLPARTDRDGRCVVTGVPAGAIRIGVGHEHLMPLPPRTIDVAPGARARVEFRAAPAARILVEPKEAPSASLVLVLEAADGRVVAERRYGDGGFVWSLSVAEPGTYRLRCDVDGISMPTRMITLRLRETEVVTFE
jgi:hypothetical protein